MDVMLGASAGCSDMQATFWCPPGLLPSGDFGALPRTKEARGVPGSPEVSTSLQRREQG